VTVKDIQVVKAVESKKADKSLDQAEDKGKAIKSLDVAHARSDEAKAELRQLAAAKEENKAIAKELADAFRAKAKTGKIFAEEANSRKPDIEKEPAKASSDGRTKDEDEDGEGEWEIVLSKQAKRLAKKSTKTFILHTTSIAFD